MCLSSRNEGGEFNLVLLDWFDVLTGPSLKHKDELELFGRMSSFKAVYCCFRW